MDKSLANSQKQSIYYDIIMPVVQQSRAQGANDDVTQSNVMNALTTFKSDDPTMMSAVKMVQRALPENLDRFQTVWAVTMQRGKMRPQAQRIGRDPVQASQQLESTLPWLNPNK
jgi:hypothetical protein